MSYFGSNSNALSYSSYGNQPSLNSKDMNRISNITQANNGSEITRQQRSQVGGMFSSLDQQKIHVPQNASKHLQSLLEQRDSLGVQLSQTTGRGAPEVNNAHVEGSTKRGQQGQKKERKNKPGHRFGAKKKSWVWSWFVQDSQDPNVAACDYCGKIITRLVSDKGSPKKLSEHLKTHRLTRNSINSSRPIPIDGNGMTYAPNGIPLNYTSNYSVPEQGQVSLQPQLMSNGPMSASTQQSSSQVGNNYFHQLAGPAGGVERQKHGPYKRLHKTGNYETNLSNFGLNTNKRYLSTDFDNSPYSAIKFHKHLMKFLTENRLSINVIKSHSFQQLIYDLKSDSVAELIDLTNLYSSLLEVSRLDSSSMSSTSASNPPAEPDMPSVSEASVANSLSQVVELRMTNPPQLIPMVDATNSN